MKKVIAFMMAAVLIAVTMSAVFTVSASDGAAAPDQKTEEKTENVTGTKAIAAAIVVGVAAAVGAGCMAVAIASSTGAMARQPEAAGKINSAMLLGLVFIETAIIYALIVAILIIFVL